MNTPYQHGTEQDEKRKRYEPNAHSAIMNDLVPPATKY